MQPDGSQQTNVTANLPKARERGKPQWYPDGSHIGASIARTSANSSSPGHPQPSRRPSATTNSWVTSAATDRRSCHATFPVILWVMKIADAP